MAKAANTEAAKPAEATAPTRGDLDEALGMLPGDQTDPDYVVDGMRAYFGTLFTDADEARVRHAVRPPPPVVETVAMRRNPDFHPAPHSADVHPDEVEAWTRGGWVVDDGAH